MLFVQHHGPLQSWLDIELQRWLLDYWLIKCSSLSQPLQTSIQIFVSTEQRLKQLCKLELMGMILNPLVRL
jgi:hypothetical protein